MENTTPQVVIETKDLSFHYPGHHGALKGVSVEFYRNQITAIIGPSGCGKSTLLRVFNRMFELYPKHQAEGKVWLDGEDIFVHDITALRQRVGMVFQKPTPFPMSIYDNIAFGVKLHERLDRAAMDERVEESLHKAGVWGEVKDRLKGSALSLSGGQQQRLCIARTIAVRPEVLLLDEPTSALDPISTARIEALLDELKAKYTIVMVTHSIRRAARMSDRVAFMYLGELVEAGTAKEIFENPKDKRTSDYVTGRFG